MWQLHVAIRNLIKGGVLILRCKHIKAIRGVVALISYRYVAVD